MDGSGGCRERVAGPVENLKKWSGRPDLNRGPPRPERGALPCCATPRPTMKARATKPPAPLRVYEYTGRRNLHPPHVPCRAINIANCEPDIVRSTLGCFQVRVDVPHIQHRNRVRTEQNDRDGASDPPECAGKRRLSIRAGRSGRSNCARRTDCHVRPRNPVLGAHC